MRINIKSKSYGLRNIRRSLTGEPHEADPDMMQAMFRDWRRS